jgi:hypothetical protein
LLSTLDFVGGKNGESDESPLACNDPAYSASESGIPTVTEGDWSRD